MIDALNPLELFFFFFLLVTPGNTRACAHTQIHSISSTLSEGIFTNSVKDAQETDNRVCL